LLIFATAKPKKAFYIQAIAKKEDTAPGKAPHYRPDTGFQ
jgi:hypothetical protein